MSHVRLLLLVPLLLPLLLLLLRRERLRLPIPLLFLRAMKTVSGGRLTSRSKKIVIGSKVSHDPHLFTWSASALDYQPYLFAISLRFTNLYAAHSTTSLPHLGIGVSMLGWGELRRGMFGYEEAQNAIMNNILSRNSCYLTTRAAQSIIVDAELPLSAFAGIPVTCPFTGPTVSCQVKLKWPVRLPAKVIGECV